VSQMKVRFAVLLPVLICGSLLFAQTKTTGSATNEAPCSPAVTGDNKTFYFTYCGNDPEQAKKIVKLLNAIVEGQGSTDTKLDELLEVVGRPVKITTTESEAVPAPPGGHPRAFVNFSTDSPVDRGQFEVLCDGACTPVQVCTLLEPVINFRGLGSKSF
jgi:hypothetical protein